MDLLQNLKPVSKAVAGALVAAVVSLAARYGFNVDDQTREALEVVVTAVLGAVAGYIGVYFAPKNTKK